MEDEVTGKQQVPVLGLISILLRTTSARFFYVSLQV